MFLLTPTQIRALKLINEAPLFPKDSNKWTHLNATVTYAKTDRFRERPQKIKVVSTQTLEELKAFGLVERQNLEHEVAKDSHQITMAGKIWLLKNK